MLNKKLSLLSCLLFGILFCIVPVMASAAFPEKAVTMIIPFDAGGASDIVGRKLAQVAEKYLGQTIIIVNRPGGSGATGYAETMQAKPDGYTVCAALSTIVIHKVMGTLPQGHDAFDIIGAYNFDPGAMAVNVERPWKDLKSFIEYAKANPNKVTVGTSAAGGIWNVGTVAIESATGARFNIIASGGGVAKPAREAAGGHIDAVCGSPNELLAHVESGKLRLLAVTSEERLPAFPDVPTFKELGYDVVITGTRAVIAPKGLPEPAFKALKEAFRKAANDPEYQKFLKDIGSGSLYLDDAAVRKLWDNQTTMFSTILNQAKQMHGK